MLRRQKRFSKTGSGLETEQESIIQDVVYHGKGIKIWG